jgi:chromate transporter
MRRLEWLAALPIVKLAWIFLKIGLVFFGGGYVLIPLIHRELVVNQHLLTQQEFLDGTAISQLTPGPLAVLSTFAGYRIGGVLGAIVGTIAVFTPGTLLMLFLSASYAKLGKHESVRGALSTLTPTIIGLLISAAWVIGRESICHLSGLAIFAIALVALIRFRLNPALLIGAAALAGVAFKL